MNNIKYNYESRNDYKLKMQLRQVRVSRYRYVNLILFVMAGCCNAVATQAFSAIGPLTRDLYEVSQISVNINSMAYSIMYPFVLFPTNYIIQTYGLKIGTLTGEMFICLGLCVRLLINVNFYYFVAGTFLTGFGFCFMLNSPNKFVVNWFSVSQIPIMNAICIFSIFMSDSLGTFASAAFLDKKSTKTDFFNFFAIQSAIIITILVLMAIFFRGEPKHPPNYASQAPRSEYLGSMRLLITNKNYHKLFASMTFIFGSLNIFFVCLSWILQAYGFQAIQTGIIFIVANISGLFGCVITGFLFDNKNYRRNCIVYVYVCIAALLVMLLGLQIHQPWVVYVGAGIFGFHIFPYLTTMTDFASQTAFPVGQAISAGSLLFGGQILGVISSSIMTLFVFDGKSISRTHIGQAVILGIMAMGAVCLHFSKSILRRSDYEQDKIKKTVHLLTESDNAD